MKSRFSEPVATKDIAFVLLMDVNGTEIMYDDWTSTIDPSWDTLVYEFQRVEEDGTLDPGNYIMRIYRMILNHF